MTLHQLFKENSYSTSQKNLGKHVSLRASRVLLRKIVNELLEKFKSSKG